MCPRRREFRLIALLLLASIVAWPQLQLGPWTLARIEAPTLKDPTHLQVAVGSQFYMASVGGVAFDQVASPAPGLAVKSLSLEYLKARPDGQRLGIILNGAALRSNLYDWQLIPIASFADSPYNSVITLFGHLNDQAQEEKLRAEGRDIINYHPALDNTLLGLRIFQFDVLILDMACTELPKQDGRYILGAGETEPDLTANQMGWNHYVRELAGAGSRQRFRSYLICDYGRPIHFTSQAGRLILSGEPLFYMWRYKMDEPGYREAAVRQRVMGEIARERQAARKQLGPAFDEREWLITALLRQAEAYAQGYNLYSAGTLVDLLHVQGEEARRNFLRRYRTDSLGQLLLDMRVRMDAHQVVYLKEDSERLSNNPDILRAINPTVWDAGVNLMRYAAFFRYVKRDHPNQWRRFLGQIRGVRPLPEVLTPTTWDRKGAVPVRSRRPRQS